MKVQSLNVKSIGNMELTFVYSSTLARGHTENLPTLYINGKFCAQNITGVQRTALETVRAMDEHLYRRGMVQRCVLVTPVRPPELKLRHIEIQVVPGMLPSLQWWEQVQLPRAIAGGKLLNLSGSAPLSAASHSYCVLHDAAVFDHPGTYRQPFRLWYRNLFKVLGRRAVALATISSFSSERLQKHIGVSANRFQVIHNGSDHFERVRADPSVLQSYGLSAGRFLLFVGTEKHTKNADRLLAAWHAMPHRDGRALVWVGGQNACIFRTRPHSTNKIAKELSDGVYRVGTITDERLKALYESAAGLVVPSIYEGFGLPAVEAMANGCPVAAATAGSLPEVCGDAALYFDPTCTVSMGNAMQRLLDCELTRTSLRARGLERADELTWHATARNLVGWLSTSGVWERCAA